MVRRVPAESLTAGGIVLPGSVQEQPQEGRVLSVGDGPLLPSGERSPQQVLEGDRVVFRSYAGTEVKVDGEQLLILREEDILAVLQ